MDLYEEFEQVIDALAEAGTDYALCGGLAVGLHGYRRFEGLKEMKLMAGRDQDILDLKKLGLIEDESNEETDS
jgi:hypothetical protein